MRAFAFVLAISLVAATPAPAAPARVASLNLCTDELLLALAAPEQIVSVSYLAQQPLESPMWRQARRYAKNDGSLFSVVRHRPDLVIGMGGGGRDSERIARRLGMKVLTLPYPQGLRDMLKMVTDVAHALGRPAAGNALIGRIEALRRTAPPRLREAVWLGGGGRSLPPIGLGAEWMALAGFRQPALPGDRMTLEQLVADPPDILLRSDYRSGQYSAEQAWLAHPLVVRGGGARTVPTDGRRWTCMGPPMVDEILRLRALAVR